MGNQTGSASGQPTTMKKGMGMMGSSIMQAGQQYQNQDDALLTQLAKMGPPPQIMMNSGPSPSAGQDLVGKYKGQMARPSVNYRSRLGNQLNPSVGQMLTGVA